MANLCHCKFKCMQLCKVIEAVHVYDVQVASLEKPEQKSEK